MTRPLRRAATLLTSLTVTAAGLSAGLAVTTAAPARAQIEPTTQQVDVSGASFTWDLNNEATSGAFAPGSWNLMSAGRIGDPGAGGSTLTTASDGALWSNGAAAGWSASAGNVTVEDLQAGATYALATFAGTRTNSAGANANTSGVRGETRLVFADGTGVVDPEAGTASLAWDGDATLLSYSGLTFFYLTDPQLDVTADGTGTLTATTGGYATSMEDPDQWDALPETEVTLATLSDVDITDEGITSTPTYREVAYDAAASSSPQARSGADWGSFPASFVDFQQSVGQGPYWYSTGGAADVRKVANPIVVDYDTVDPVSRPVVTVSDTDLLPSGAYQVSVTGTGFEPEAAIGTRPPLAGKSAGVYVTFGKYRPEWRPSTGAPSTSRKNSSVAWAVLAEDMATIGGAPAGAIELTPAGTFATELTVDKSAIDTLTADDATLTNYGFYTYPGSGATNADYETYTPVTFTKASSSTVIDAPRKKFGQRAGVKVRVASPDAPGGSAEGTVTLSRGSTIVDAQPLTNGTALFRLGRPAAGRYGFTATFSGNASTAGSTTTGTLKVGKASSASTVRLSPAPKPTRTGAAVVKVTSPTTTTSGKVTVRLSKGTATIKKGTGRIRDGKLLMTLPRLRAGRYTVLATYAGSADVKGSSKSITFRVR